MGQNSSRLRHDNSQQSQPQPALRGRELQSPAALISENVLVKDENIRQEEEEDVRRLCVGNETKGGLLSSSSLPDSDPLSSTSCSAPPSSSTLGSMLPSSSMVHSSSGVLPSSSKLSQTLPTSSLLSPTLPSTPLSSTTQSSMLQSTLPPSTPTTTTTSPSRTLKPTSSSRKSFLSLVKPSSLRERVTSLTLPRRRGASGTSFGVSDSISTSSSGLVPNTASLGGNGEGSTSLGGEGPTGSSRSLRGDVTDATASTSQIPTPKNEKKKSWTMNSKRSVEGKGKGREVDDVNGGVVNGQHDNVVDDTIPSCAPLHAENVDPLGSVLGLMCEKDGGLGEIVGDKVDREVGNDESHSRDNGGEVKDDEEEEEDDDDDDVSVYQWQDAESNIGVTPRMGVVGLPLPMPSRGVETEGVSSTSMDSSTALDSAVDLDSSATLQSTPLDSILSVDESPLVKVVDVDDTSAVPLPPSSSSSSSSSSSTSSTTARPVVSSSDDEPLSFVRPVSSPMLRPAISPISRPVPVMPLPISRPTPATTSASIPATVRPTNPAMRPTNQATRPTNPATTQHPRAFPPPGTLVVVQGIVHTTDVSRVGGNGNTNNNVTSAGSGSSAVNSSSTANSNTNGNSNSNTHGTANAGSSSNTNAIVNTNVNPDSRTSTPRPGSSRSSEGTSTPGRTRNRLSALLRPRSGIFGIGGGNSSSGSGNVAGGNNGSGNGNAGNVGGNGVPTLTVTPPSDGDIVGSGGGEDRTGERNEERQEEGTDERTEERTGEHREQVEGVREEREERREGRVPNLHAISSSSIDVLGTLLSVAAAATAASLLTGSSEPILSSGLAPPSTGSNPNSNSTTNSTTNFGTSNSMSSPVFSNTPSTPSSSPISNVTSSGSPLSDLVSVSPSTSTSLLNSSSSSSLVNNVDSSGDSYVSASGSEVGLDGRGQAHGNNRDSAPVHSHAQAQAHDHAHNHAHGHNAIPVDNSIAGRTERMRQAWSTIRERLGLRGHEGNGNGHAGNANVGIGNNNAGNIGGGGGGGDNGAAIGGGGEPANPPLDTRELMLAEMARAFNIGLGLNPGGDASSNSNGGLSNSNGGAGGNANANQAQAGQGGGGGGQGGLTAEGSFERFLVDLQIDLRAALTAVDEGVDVDERVGGVNANANVGDVTGVDEAEATRRRMERERNEEEAEAAILSWAVGGDDGSEVVLRDEDGDVVPGLETDSDSSDDDDEEEDSREMGMERQEQVVIEREEVMDEGEESDRLSMPALASVSDSDSEDDDEEFGSGSEESGGVFESGDERGWDDEDDFNSLDRVLSRLPVSVPVSPSGVENLAAEEDEDAIMAAPTPIPVVSGGVDYANTATDDATTNDTSRMTTTVNDATRTSTSNTSRTNNNNTSNPRTTRTRRTDPAPAAVEAGITRTRETTAASVQPTTTTSAARSTRRRGALSSTAPPRQASQSQTAGVSNAAATPAPPHTPFSPGPSHTAYGPGPSNPNPNPSALERERVSGRMDSSGRINWWRLYRFPPIVAQRGAMGGGETTTTTTTTTSGTQTEAGTQTQAQAGQATTEGDVLSPISSRTVVDHGPTAGVADAPTTAAGPTTPPASIPLNSVVPVILVGLQSVNQADGQGVPHHLAHQHQHDHGPHGGHTNGAGGGRRRRGGRTPVPDDDFDLTGRWPESGEHEYDENDEEDEDDEDHSADEDEEEEWETQERERERREHESRESRASRWQSRAANVIRNFRGGSRRREGADATGANGGVAGDARNVDIPLNAPGSRTFLIYVIGGYYPPDHSIVTGGPANFESFEALLELADLLGQVKPPTVSKDEIEKSGLEIIKASEMEACRDQGKVSDNCLERCLICLDDYQPEEDVRLMTCRHAFHKTCVDEWLQRGRNNCPACRSTGVSNGADATPS